MKKFLTTFMMILTFIAFNSVYAQDDSDYVIANVTPDGYDTLVEGLDKGPLSEDDTKSVIYHTSVDDDDLMQHTVVSENNIYRRVDQTDSGYKVGDVTTVHGTKVRIKRVYRGNYMVVVPIGSFRREVGDTFIVNISTPKES